MVSLSQLWLPILLATVLVFVASSLVHMVIKWHNPDYLKLPNEDAVREALNAPGPLAPGQYVLPHCMDMKAMGDPAVARKYEEGPVAMLLVREKGRPQVGPSLLQWLLLNAVVALFAAYLAAHALPAGAPYKAVFRVVGTVFFIAHATGSVTAAIWMARPWKVVLKECADALIYALVAAGAFGWLWPR